MERNEDGGRKGVLKSVENLITKRTIDETRMVNWMMLRR